MAEDHDKADLGRTVHKYGPVHALAHDRRARLGVFERCPRFHDPVLQVVAEHKPGIVQDHVGVAALLSSRGIAPGRARRGERCPGGVADRLRQGPGARRSPGDVEDVHLGQVAPEAVEVAVPGVLCRVRDKSEGLDHGPAGREVLAPGGEGVVRPGVGGDRAPGSDGGGHGAGGPGPEGVRQGGGAAKIPGVVFHVVGVHDRGRGELEDLGVAVLVVPHVRA